MTQDDYVEGFGVVDRAGLRLNTVSDTRRAAIVNWLCLVAEVLVTKLTTDEQIEALWQKHSYEIRGGATVVRVRAHVQP